MIALLAALIGLQQPQGAQAVAELLQARQWTIVDGLPQSSVNDLAVSSSGELWLATFGGLVAFDGTRFRSHDIDAVQDLPSNRITALARGEGSDLWLTTQSGELVRMQAGKVLEVHHLPGGPTEALCLLRHPDGGLWVQTSSGAVLIFKTGAWTEVVSGGLGGSYEGMCLIGDGDVITSRGRILMRLDANGRELQRWEAGVRITAVGSTRRGDVWVGLQKGLALLKSGELLPWTGKTELDQAVLVLHEGADGSMFVGTRRGLYQLHAAQGGGLVGPLGPESLGAIEVRSICLDPEGNLWLGTSASGLVRLRPSRIESLPALQMLGGVSALAPDGQGGLWVGQECRGLTHVEAGTRACLTEPAPILGGVEHCPFALSRDSRGRLWLGSSTAVLRRETVDAPWQPIVPRDVLGERAGPMLELDDGEYLVTSQAGMLLRLDAGDRIIQRQVLPGAIHSLLRAHDGSVWIGSDGQLMQWTPQSLRVLGSEQGIPRCAVRDLLQGGDGVLWLATYGAGLLSWKGDKLRSFSRSQGLPDTALNKLASDGVRLWASSNLGLIVFEWSELEEWRSGRRERIDPIIYGPESGLEETNYGQPSGLQLEDGSLWFGTLSGVARVDPARFPFNPHPPVPRIEQILVDDESLAEPYEIPAGSRRIVIEYGAISLTAADRVRYRYRLQGFDDSWEEAGRTQQASFTDLKPGDYRLEFQARNEDGIWSQSALSPSLRVLPRWWQRTPVQVIGVLTTAGLLFLLHRLRIRSLSRRTEALVAATRGRMEAEERESRLREELAHVARVATAGELASSLAHEVNQPLGAIVHNTHAAQILLERGKQSDVREILSDIGSQAERASTVIRRLREFLRKDPGRREVIDLNQLIDATMPLMRREIADSRVRVSLELALALPGVQADPVQMQQVLVNLIKNACEALARVPGERRMVIRTMHEAGRVAFEVVDNGPGLAPGVSERLFQPYVTTKRGGMGLGLAICRSIMEAHGGHLLAQRGREQGLVLRGDLPLHS